MKFLGFAVFVCLTQIIKYSDANKCRGYDIKLLGFENDKDDQIAAVDTRPQFRPSVKVNDKCELRVQGCLTIKTPITSAKLSFKVKKDDKLELLDQEDIDLCEILADSNYPPGCPLYKPPVARICDNFDYPIKLEKYAHFLPKLVGKIYVEAVVETNGKKKSIFNLILSVEKAK